MLASFTWLRALCPATEDVRRAAEALTSRGLTVDAITAAGEDHALDIDVPANRPDCLGHLGLARELSAAFDIPLAEGSPPALESSGCDEIEVVIEAHDLCGRYSAGLVRGITVGPSPEWVVERLEVCGLRSVNNIVDASNLVMLELGNPVHFFDLDLLVGDEIRVRRAHSGEMLRTLDGETRKLDPEMLVIADTERAIALAGVIGGTDSEINDRTREVLIEAAWFQPRSVRDTSRRLGLQTDASYRFERGVDPEGIVPAQLLAARLLTELGGGETSTGIRDVYPSPLPARWLTLRLEQIARLLGYAPGEEAVLRALGSLQLSPRPLDEERLEISVPSWRTDLEREADAVEEVARHLGYDKIPTVTGELPFIVGAADEEAIEERSRDLLSHLGFHEALGYAMIAENDDQPYVQPAAAPGLRLTNPIAESLASLRRSIMPGLLSAVDLNHRRGVRDVRLFEIGHVFLSQDAGLFPAERNRVGIAWSGRGQPAHWALPDRDVDVFDIMGVVEQLLACLRPGIRFERRRSLIPAHHPGRAVVWSLESGEEVAWGGPLNPDLLRSMVHQVQIAEIDLDSLELLDRAIPQFTPLPRLTPINRDLSLVMASDVSYGAILDAVESIPPPAPVEFSAVDYYSGPQLARGESSLTIRFTLQPMGRNLGEDAIENYRRDLIDVLDGRLGLKIRA
jgi:phenylalanyl-tRNA synthetase beta chain